MSSPPCSHRRQSLIATACLLVAASGHAGESQTPLPVALEYTAIPECPSAEVFWSALQARSSRVERRAPANAETRLQVNVIWTPQGVLGRLQIVRGQVITEPRFVEAADCDEVVQALALTAALSVEAERSADPEPPPSPYTEDTLSGVTTPRQPPPRTFNRWDTLVLAHGTVAAVVDSDPSVGVGGAIMFVRRRGGLPQQVLGLGVAYLGTGVFSTEQPARFALTETEVTGCPLSFGGSVVAFRPCATLQVGVLEGSGQNLSNPENSQRMWWALGGGIALELPASSSVRMHLELSAQVPMNPQRYQVGLDERQTVATTLSVSPWLRLGLAYEP